MANFFKSKAFSFILHTLIVAGGAYLSYNNGTALPAVVAGGITALLKSPLDTVTPPKS